MFRGQFEWLSALPLLIVTGILAVMAIVTLTGAQSPAANSREVLFDYFQRMTPASYDPADKFQIVLIDRESVDAIGPWPWPRTMLAQLVSAAKGAGAKAVVLTDAVDAPDPLSPETIGKFWLEGASDETLARQLERLPQTDEALANAFNGFNGAVAVSQTPPQNPNRANALQRADTNDSDWLSVSGSANYLALPAARYFYGLNDNLKRAAQPAVSALMADTDGVVRRAPVLWSLNGAPTPSLALEAARLASDDATIEVVIQSGAANTQGRIVNSVGVNGNHMRVAQNSAIRLHLPKRLSVPTSSARQLMTGTGSNSQLADAVVFIGLDTELGGTVTTARGDMAPATLHALAAAQFASGAAPNRPGWTGYVEALGVMIFGAAAMMMAQRMQFWQAIGFAAALSAILLLGAFASFAISNLLINPLPAATALFVGALSVAGGKSIGGVLRDDTMRGSFHDTLPEPAMAKLRDTASTEILDGVHRDITVLACELRLADEDLQQLENLPNDVTKILAAASLELRQTIIDTGGAADQAEGGRLFAYFNAPTELADHAQAGCAAALRLIESMDKINADLEGSSRTRGVQIHLAIGIAVGECFVGPMGHGRNNRYSAIGPAVDRAAFLRSQSEFYGPAMICDEAIFRKTNHHFAYLELDKLRARTAERPFSIYALIGNPFIKSSKGFRDLDETHREMLAAYRNGDAAAARRTLEKVKLSPGAKIALFDIYEERIARLEQTGPSRDWDGVHAAEI